MKDPGMYRKIDVLGRIVVPSEIRKSLNLVEGDQLDITLDEGRIILEPANNSCRLCGTRSDLKPFGDKSVCAGCRQALIAQEADAFIGTSGLAAVR